jgi:hypothetical protein
LRKTSPAYTDISALEPGVYEILDSVSSERRGWLYRPASEEVAVGATHGNCRYSIALPPGTYKIKAWHPHLFPVETVVKVRARVVTRVYPVFSRKKLLR